LVQLDTGTGKTALCFTIACHYANLGNKVFIINVSEELTFRDFKKASQTIDATGISICLLDDPDAHPNYFEGIAFASFKVFQALHKNQRGLQLDDCVVIVDEFDRIIFGDKDHTNSGLELLASINTMIGLSGSDMKDFHVRALEQVMLGQTMKMNITNIYKPEVKNWGVDVFSKISDYRLSIEQMSL
jgi:archaellum biogenesis ATPase FlaH